MIDADKRDNMIDVISYALNIRVELKFTLSCRCDDRLRFGITRSEVLAFKFCNQVFKDILIFTCNGVDEGSAEIDLDHTAVLRESPDHVVGHVALEARREMTTGGVRGDDRCTCRGDNIIKCAVGNV